MKKRKRNYSKKRSPFRFKLIILLAIISSGFFLYQETNSIHELIHKIQESNQSGLAPSEQDSNETPKQNGILASTIESIRGFPSQEQAASPIIKTTGLNSANMILIDRKTGKVLIDKKSKEKMFPASLTKIMTVLLGVEELGDLDQKVLMKEEYFEGLFEMDASMAGFQIGEIVSYRDILYGAILPSGAESCLAIAQLLYDSEDTFVERMNERAEELGLKNTHFSNTTGLHDTKNYSTTEDIATLLDYALQNKEFSRIFRTKEFTTSPTNLSVDGVEMKSSLFRYIKNFPQLDPLLTGGKTGFTEEAGLCLASIAEINGKEYLLVTAGAPFEEPGESLHIQDAALIYLQLANS